MTLRPFESRLTSCPRGADRGATPCAGVRGHRPAQRDPRNPSAAPPSQNGPRADGRARVALSLPASQAPPSLTRPRGQLSRLTRDDLGDVEDRVTLDVLHGARELAVVPAAAATTTTGSRWYCRAQLTAAARERITPGEGPKLRGAAVAADFLVALPTRRPHDAAHAKPVIWGGLSPADGGGRWLQLSWLAPQRTAIFPPPAAVIGRNFQRARERVRTSAT